MIKDSWNSIAIAGEAGTGKTAAANGVGSILGWQVFGAGGEFRSSRKSKGIIEIGAEAGSDGDHDQIDEYMAHLMRVGNWVVEGRVAGLVAVINNIPNVLKILLVNNNEEERIARIFHRSDKYHNIDEARVDTLTRESQNQRVFTRRYQGLSYLNESLYNIVIDTHINDEIQTQKLIIQQFR